MAKAEEDWIKRRKRRDESIKYREETEEEKSQKERKKELFKKALEEAPSDKKDKIKNLIEERREKASQRKGTADPTRTLRLGGGIAKIDRKVLEHLPEKAEQRVEEAMEKERKEKTRKEAEKIEEKKKIGRGKPAAEELKGWVGVRAKEKLAEGIEEYESIQDLLKEIQEEFSKEAKTKEGFSTGAAETWLRKYAQKDESLQNKLKILGDKGKSMRGKKGEKESSKEPLEESEKIKEEEKEELKEKEINEEKKIKEILERSEEKVIEEKVEEEREEVRNQLENLKEEINERVEEIKDMQEEKNWKREHLSNHMEAMNSFEKTLVDEAISALEKEKVNPTQARNRLRKAKKRLEESKVGGKIEDSKDAMKELRELLEEIL